MEPLGENSRNGEGMNLSDGIGMKRASEGVEGNSVVKKVRIFEEVDENGGAVEKVKVAEHLEGVAVFEKNGECNGNIGEMGTDISEEGGIRNGAVEMVKIDEHLEGVAAFRKNGESNGSVGEATTNILEEGGIKNGAVGAGEFAVRGQEVGVLSVVGEFHKLLNGNLGNANGGNDFGFDLNVPVLEAGDGGTLVGLPECTQRNVDIVEISSDESSHGEEIMDKGKGKQIEEIRPDDVFGDFRYEFGFLDKDQDIGGSNSLDGWMRYTIEEKGKAKVDDSWLSLATLPMELHLQHREQLQEAVAAVPMELDLQDWEQQQEAVAAVPQLEPLRVRPGIEALHFEYTRRLAAERAEREAIALRKQAIRFARGEGSSSQEKKLPTLETFKGLGNTHDPFFTALKRITEQIPKGTDKKLFRWEASQSTENRKRPRVSPSLLELSLKALAENADAIVSLMGVPDILRQRLIELLCRSRKMSAHMLKLLVQGSPTQIRVKDCSWLTEKDFRNSFEDIDRRNLMVLQLDLCGQCTLDYLLGEIIAPASNSLPNLAIMSLRGACRMSDRAMETLVTSAPSLQSIDLGQCSLLTHTSIEIAANSLGSILKELYIDDCQNINAIRILPALRKLEHLEVLSVAGIDSVCDQFVRELVASRGQNIKELDFSNCQNLTDQSLKFIGDTCTNLHSLNISNLTELTDVGLQFLAYGCQSIRRLKFCRNSFSDEGIAAFLETSGACLEELSLNNCSKVSASTAYSLGKSSRKLLHLDLSWCRRINDEELGWIVENCSSLKLLKLFGCTQITTVFINGHSNNTVQIIGWSMHPILGNISSFDGVDVLLKYSPLLASSNSEGASHYN